MYEVETLEHFGIKGMRWGHRKQSIQNYVNKRRQAEQDYQKKIATLASKKSGVKATDVARFKYANQSLAKKIGKEAKDEIISMVVSDFFRGGIGQYASMSKGDIARKAATIAGRTAVSVIKKEALARSASTRYTSDGKLKNPKDKSILTREDKIEFAILTATYLQPVAKYAIGVKTSRVRAERARNEAAFMRWGGRILSEKADNVVWMNGPD